MTTRGSSADLLAGLSIAGLLLPEALAYPGVANLPPQAGVIGLFAGLACYGLIGRSLVCRLGRGKALFQRSRINTGL